MPFKHGKDYHSKISQIYTRPLTNLLGSDPHFLGQKQRCMNCTFFAICGIILKGNSDMYILGISCVHIIISKLECLVLLEI